MKKLLIILMLIFSLCLSAFILTACNNKENGGENTPPHIHEYSSEYSFDADNHWNECVCKDKANITQHNLVNNECVCGYKIEVPTNEAKGLYKRDGDYIYFGKYPQTIKEESVTVSEMINTSGYFTGSDGEEYAKVVADPFNTNTDDNITYRFSNSENVVEGNIYYFKVEPIRWRILSEDSQSLTILCDSIIANRRYDDSSNNYKESEIRVWLNEEFYNTAFSPYEQEIIKTILVDNSLESTGYSEIKHTCENTQDKIYLLSYAEAKTIIDSNSDSKYFKILTSDYTRATGAFMHTDDYYGNGFWWLRSPHKQDGSTVQCVGKTVWLGYGSLVIYNEQGIVPALTIQLN